MSTHEALSSLPPAVLRVALEAAEKRVQQEKDKIRREMDRLQKQLDELEWGPVEKQKDITSRPKRREAQKRQRELDYDTDSDAGGRYGREWPIVKVRRSDRRSQRGSQISPSCSACQRKGVNCEWDDNPATRKRKCLPCYDSRRLCNLKRPGATNR